MPSQNTPARRWCFTLNNPTEDETPTCAGLGADFLVYQLEEGKEGTPHFQGYIEFPKLKRFNAVKSLIGERAHLEKCAGTQKENITYCTKEEGRIKGPVFDGVPHRTGQAAISQSIVERVNEGRTLKEAVLEDPRIVLNINAFKAAQDMLKEPRDFKTEVHWIYGPSGVGKSRTAYEEAGKDAYWKPLGHKWWNGYDYQPNVVLDDFRQQSLDSEMNVQYLLNLFDRYPFSVEEKGSVKKFTSKKIWVTSIDHPNFYFHGDDWTQIERRITSIRRLGDMSFPNRPSTPDRFAQIFTRPN